MRSERNNEIKAEKKGLFFNRSKALFFAGIIGVLYAIYIVSYFASTMTTGSNTSQAAGFIATALVTPHMALVVAGTIFLLIGFFSRKPWAALTGSIVYCVAAVVFLMYAFFCIPSIVLGFVGYSKQKKILNELHEE